MFYFDPRNPFVLLIIILAYLACFEGYVYLAKRSGKLQLATQPRLRHLADINSWLMPILGVLFFLSLSNTTLYVELQFMPPIITILLSAIVIVLAAIAATTWRLQQRSYNYLFVVLSAIPGSIALGILLLTIMKLVYIFLFMPSIG